MEMLYAIGCGARGLFSYTDATEAGGDLIFHSSADLPEIWQEIGRTSRALRVVAPLIEIAHPTVWATANKETLWVSTLISGDMGALVAVVNEDCVSDTKGFAQKSARNVSFTFPDLPWLKGQKAMRVEDGRLIELEAQRGDKRLSWSEPGITDAAIYLVLSNPAIARHLKERATTERPVATEAGKQKGPESYLRGRRFTRASEAAPK